METIYIYSAMATVDKTGRGKGPTQRDPVPDDSEQLLSRETMETESQLSIVGSRIVSQAEYIGTKPQELWKEVSAHIYELLLYDVFLTGVVGRQEGKSENSPISHWDQVQQISRPTLTLSGDLILGPHIALALQPRWK
jgi:hypothetical protein